MAITLRHAIPGRLHCSWGHHNILSPGCIRLTLRIPSGLSANHFSEYCYWQVSKTFKTSTNPMRTHNGNICAWNRRCPRGSQHLWHLSRLHRLHYVHTVTSFLFNLIHNVLVLSLYLDVRVNVSSSNLLHIIRWIQNYTYSLSSLFYQ